MGKCTGLTVRINEEETYVVRVHRRSEVLTVIGTSDRLYGDRHEYHDTMRSGQLGYTLCNNAASWCLH
jgi:hypothetical protein